MSNRQSKTKDTPIKTQAEIRRLFSVDLMSEAVVSMVVAGRASDLLTMELTVVLQAD